MKVDKQSRTAITAITNEMRTLVPVVKDYRTGELLGLYYRHIPDVGHIYEPLAGETSDDVSLAMSLQARKLTEPVIILFNAHIEKVDKNANPAILADVLSSY
jgi:hypothetical protein